MGRRSAAVGLIASACLLAMSACAPVGPEEESSTEEVTQALNVQEAGLFACQLTSATTVAVTPVSGVVGRATRLRAAVTRQGAPLVAHVVSFRVDGVNVGSAVTNAAGVARLAWTPSGAARTAPVTATITGATTLVRCVPTGASGAGTASINAAPGLDTGRVGGTGAYLDPRAATSSEMRQEPGMVAAEITVRRSRFGAGTTARNGTVPISFTAGPGAPPASPACDPRGPSSCAPRALHNDGVVTSLNDGLGVYSIGDRRAAPAMAGVTTVTTTSWDPVYQDAWDACAVNAASLGRATWGHNAYLALPMRVGRLYQYTYPTQSLRVVCLVANCYATWSYSDVGAYRLRYLDVFVSARVTCAE